MRLGTRAHPLVSAALALWLFGGFSLRGAPAFELFAFDNGVGRGTWPAARQAETLREIGYAGISYNYTTVADLKLWLAELGARKLKLHALYLGASLHGAEPFPAGFAEAVALLRGTGAVVWLTLPAAPKTDRAADAAAALARVREAADLAERSQVRVVLYPHKGFHVATAEQAFALAVESGRADVGVTVNLAHELAAGHGPRLPAILRAVAPRLALVSLNGASDRPGPGWENYIRLLGDGDYDVPGLLRTLTAVGYRGPVGIQFYNVKGDPLDNLRATMRVWRALP
jgi:sugar phosphate isomerase/epimerase